VKHRNKVAFIWLQLSKSIWAKFFENQQSTDTFKKKVELWRDVYKAVRYLNLSQAYKHDVIYKYELIVIEQYC